MALTAFYAHGFVKQNSARFTDGSWVFYILVVIVKRPLRETHVFLLCVSVVSRNQILHKYMLSIYIVQMMCWYF